MLYIHRVIAGQNPSLLLLQCLPNGFANRFHTTELQTFRRCNFGSILPGKNTPCKSQTVNLLKALGQIRNRAHLPGQTYFAQNDGGTVQRCIQKAGRW